MKKMLCLLLCGALLLPLCFGCDDSSMHDGSGAEDGSQAETPPTQDPPAQDPPAQDPPAQDPPAQDPPAQDPPAQTVSVPQIIFDTDMDLDCDDAGALGLVCEYHNAGKAKLLGVVTDVPSRYAAAACEAICLEYGVNVPIGTIYSSEFPKEETDRYVSYRQMRDGINKSYNRELANRLCKYDTDYPATVRVYRELLAAAEDKSVVVVKLGLMTALSELFLSEGDDISPLSGLELFEKKVTHVVSIGTSTYPATTDLGFNHGYDTPALEHVLALCPVPIYSVWGGTNILVGDTFSTIMRREHPVRRAYEIWVGEGNGRHSWDLVGALYALEPDSGLFRVNVSRWGTMRYDDSSGLLYWDENGARNDRHVWITVTKAELEAVLEHRLQGDFTYSCLS